MRYREKKDANIYFLKNSFHEFFKLTSTCNVTYNVDEYMKWATMKYPLIEELLKKMGNPYPHEERFL